jgi:hypothetical protein
MLELLPTLMIDEAETKMRTDAAVGETGGMGPP